MSIINIRITDSESQEKGKKFIVYKVEFHSREKKWTILRRYNEFHTLYDKIKKLYPQEHLKLPGKKFFGNTDPSTILLRKEGLSDLLHKLVSNPDILQNSDVRQFLEIDSSPQGGAPTDLNANGDESADSHHVDLGQSERHSAKPSDFEFLKVIGKGSFGKVLLAKHKEEGSIFAVKVLNKAHIMKKNEAKHIMSERNVLVKNVEHPFLVGLHYSFQSSDKLYFVLDYVNGGEMFFHLQKERCFSEPRARFYAAEMASALGYLHCLNIIYRDLKPENILLDSEGHITLTDFGLCKEDIKGRETTSTFCGTPEYLAPEVLKKQPYDKTVDWWCLGAVLYEMIYGLPPFYSRDTSEMYKSILHKPLKFRSNAGSTPARNILEKLLEKNKERRLGATKDITEIKEHPFFGPINWTQLEKRQMKPPYNPNVSNDMDLRHFDPEFVREPVPELETTKLIYGRDSSVRGDGGGRGCEVRADSTYTIPEHKACKNCWHSKASVGRSYGMASASVANNNHVFDGFSYAPPVGDAFDDDGNLDDRM